MPKKDAQFLELGIRVAAVLDLAGASRKTMMINSFFRGLAQGFGAVVGGTILVAILAWSLSQFNEIPLIGPAFDSISDAVNNGK